MNKLTAYAYDLISYMMLQREFIKINVNKIILFGSVARGDYTKKSDIDLFFHSNKKNKEIIYKISQNFVNSERHTKWEVQGVKNEFHIIVANLSKNKWEGLRQNLDKNAIMLYTRYQNKDEYERRYLIKWNTSGTNVKQRMGISRFVNGYNQNTKTYIGFVERTSAKKISNSVLLTNKLGLKELKDFFKKIKITYFVTEVFEELD